MAAGAFPVAEYWPPAADLLAFCHSFSSPKFFISLNFLGFLALSALRRSCG
jgi:hypothetical protein